MRIEQVNVYPVLLPFTAEFSHSLKKINSAANVVVEVVADGGEIYGYGEAAPRVYVTGETQESVAASVRRFVREHRFPWHLDNADDLWRFTDTLFDGGLRERGHLSAICAMETALLDALGKREGVTASVFFPRTHCTASIRYGAAIPLAGRDRTLDICRRIKSALKINRIKLKLDRDLEGNRSALEAVREVFGTDCDLKVDVNGVWDPDLALAHAGLIEEFHIKVVEQPMKPGHPDIAGFAGLLKRMGVALMADESACSLADVKELIREGHYSMINVRLSKCGGMRKSLRIIDLLREHHMPFQVACHLGESGILSAAGRQMSLLCGDARYYDGSYDAFLLKENITTEDVTFGPGGKAGPMKGPGLGVTVDRERLKGLSSAPPLTFRQDGLL